MIGLEMAVGRIDEATGIDPGERLRPPATRRGAPSWVAATSRRPVALAEAIIDGISDLIVLTDEHLVIRWVSSSATDQLGYRSEQLVGRVVTDFVHRDDLAPALAAIAATDEGHWASSGIAYRIRHHDGSWRWLNCAMSILTDHPDIQGIVITAVDVSERVAAEQELARTQDWARVLVQASADLVVVVDRHGDVTFASPAVKQILGFEPAEFVGADQSELFHPDDVAGARRFLTGDALGDDGPIGQFRMRHRDGRWRVVDMARTDLLADPAVAGIVLNIRDVTSRYLAEQLLAEQADLLDAIGRGAPLGIILQRITQMVEHVIEGAHCAIGVLEPDGSIRCHAAPSVAPAVVSFLDQLPATSQVSRRLRSAGTEPLVLDLRKLSEGATRLFADHGYVTCRAAASLSLASGGLLGSVAIFQDSDRELTRIESDLVDRALNLSAVAIERRHFEATVEHQALHDPLTGLANRTLLRRRTDEALRHSRRSGRGVALTLVDLDRFKVINDSVGHNVGDELLVAAAERFTSVLRPGETLARVGGDEFMIVSSRVPDEAASGEIAARVAAVLAPPFLIGAGEIFVTASVGVAYRCDAAATAEALIREADVAMFRAKAQGRDQFVVFTADIDERARGQLALEQAIRLGIDRHEFELHYQPVVNLADGTTTQVEALVRWHRPDHGLVFPDSFIPIAEETGLIVPLGWWILEAACAEAVAWPELPGGNVVEIAVNLSACQLASPELIPAVTRALGESGLDPHRLCFEVTESALVRDVEHAKRALLALKTLGVHVAIDDFGTGYASLEYVRHFTMADYLKIDRCFVDGVDRPGSHEAAIVTAAIALARSVGLKVIAEGVETVGQMDALRALDCELAQGYLFSRPVGVDAAIALLAAPGLDAFGAPGGR